VKTVDGSFTDTCRLTVTQLVTGVSLNKTTLALLTGYTDTLTATITPATASNQALSWSSSAATVARVSAAGVVTAVAVGAASIVAKTVDGSFTDTCKLTVTLAPTVFSIAISPTTASVPRGGTRQFFATVTVDGGAAQSVSWQVADGISGTSISTSGLLTVAANEPASTLTVTATSTADSSKHIAATVTVSGTTAIATPTATALQIYPNPVVNEELVMKNDELKAGDKIELYSLSGTLLKTFAATGAESAISLSALPVGIYIVKAGGAVAKVVIVAR
jgi:uncharacterized protein YjdB